MAGSAEKLPDKRDPHAPHAPTPVQYASIRLAAKGMGPGEQARVLMDYFIPKKAGTLSERRTLARRKIRKWQDSRWYRDLLWDLTVRNLDMEIPEILGGIAKKAKRGRVDAARLVLEVTGRHNPRGGDQQPAVVQINFGPTGLPRPTADLELGEADVEEEDDG